MTINEVYEEYKHLDKLLSDKSWLPKNFIGDILYTLWQAVKDYVEENGKGEVK